MAYPDRDGNGGAWSVLTGCGDEIVLTYSSLAIAGLEGPMQYNGFATINGEPAVVTVDPATWRITFRGTDDRPEAVSE